MPLFVNTIRRFAPLLLIALFTVTCTDATGIADADRIPSDVRLASELVSLDRGEVLHLEATVYDQRGQPMEGDLPEDAVRWSSSNPQIAEITSSGRLTGAYPGETSISVSLQTMSLSSASAGMFPGNGNGNSKRSATVEVNSGATVLDVIAGDGQEGVTETTLQDSIKVRATNQQGQGVEGAKIKFSVLEGGGSLSSTMLKSDEQGFASVTWTMGSSAGENRAEVTIHERSFTGDPAILRATANQPQQQGGDDEHNSTVRVLTAEPGSHQFVALGDSIDLDVRAYDDSGAEVEGASPDYWTLNAHVATVSDQGRIHSVGDGSARIVIAAGTGADTVAIEVDQRIANVTVSPGADTLTAVGDTLPLQAEPTDANGYQVADAEITWSSSDDAVASVGMTGKVVSRQSGLALVTAAACMTSGCQEAESRVQVDQIPATVEVSAPSSSVEVGSTTQATAVAEDANGFEVDDANFEWTSSNSAVATVDNAGRVTALASGNATIRADVEDAGGSISFSVSGDDGSGGSGGDSGTYTGDLPELPRAVPDTAMPVLTDTIRVAEGGNLQAALDNATHGTLILLPQGATFSGTYYLRGSGERVLATEIALPNGRVDPALPLARIVAAGFMVPLRTDGATSGWRIQGIRIEAASNVDETFALLRIGDGQEPDPQALPSDIVLDRIVLRGHDGLDTRRCLELNAAGATLIDSHLSGCHADGFDSQAVVAWNTPGPLLIANNYLEGAGENVMFGGADPQSPENVPADITFIDNEVIKPAEWQGSRWTIKNLFEIKTATRVLVEGNVFDGSWKHAQGGSALLIKSVNQGGGNGEWSYASDITIRRNVVRNAETGFILAAQPEQPVAMPLTRVLIEDNFLESMGHASTFGVGGKAVAFSFLADIRDVSVRNNTVLGGFDNQVIFDGGGKTNFAFTSNIIDQSSYGWGGSHELEERAPGHVVTNNVMAPATWNDNLPDGNCITAPVLPVPSACAGAGSSMTP